MYRVWCFVFVVAHLSSARLARVVARVRWTLEQPSPRHHRTIIIGSRRVHKIPVDRAAALVVYVACVLPVTHLCAHSHRKNIAPLLLRPRSANASSTCDGGAALTTRRSRSSFEPLYTDKQQATQQFDIVFRSSVCGSELARGANDCVQTNYTT